MIHLPIINSAGDPKEESHPAACDNSSFLWTWPRKLGLHLKNSFIRNRRCLHRPEQQSLAQPHSQQQDLPEGTLAQPHGGYAAGRDREPTSKDDDGPASKLQGQESRAHENVCRVRPWGGGGERMHMCTSLLIFLKLEGKL